MSDWGPLAAALSAIAGLVGAVWVAWITTKGQAARVEEEADADVIMGAQRIALSLIEDLRASNADQAEELTRMREQHWDFQTIKRTVETIRTQFADQIEQSAAIRGKVEELERANTADHRQIMGRLDQLENDYRPEQWATTRLGRGGILVGGWQEPRALTGPQERSPHSTTGCGGRFAVRGVVDGDPTPPVLLTVCPLPVRSPPTSTTAPNDHSDGTAAAVASPNRNSPTKPTFRRKRSATSKPAGVRRHPPAPRSPGRSTCTSPPSNGLHDMALSPTQLTLRHLRQQGWPLVETVERWNPHARIRQDLFGIIDVLAVGPNGTLAIQATSAANALSRVNKIGCSDSIAHLREAEWEIRVWGWKKDKSNRWILHRDIDVS